METAELSKHQDCQYSLRQCHKPVMDGYQFCRTHILEDKTCPFHQCSYVSGKTGRRCAQATLKPMKKEGLCPQHSAKLNRTRCAVAKRQLANNSDTAESLLSNLERYSNTLYNNSRGEQKNNRNDNASSYLAELASSSDSDIEERTYATGSCWQPDSDSESIDSEHEDIFKYAEILTAEEVTRITRDKLIRLQSLYIEQFKWLQNTLREQRRKYLHLKETKKVNHDAYADVELSDNQSHGTIPEHDDGDTLQQYVASRRYHRRHGQEALMYMRSQDRRRAVCDPSASDGPVHNHNRYRHSSKHGTKYCSLKSARCHEKSLPFTRYCVKHVEFDAQQVLFRRCGYQAVSGGLFCERIVPNIDSYNRCDYHANVKDFQSMYSQYDDDDAFENIENNVAAGNGYMSSSVNSAVETVEDMNDHATTLNDGAPTVLSSGDQEPGSNDMDIDEQEL